MTVRYWDSRHGFWRIGELVKQTPKLATIRPLGPGRTLKVPLCDVEPIQKEGK